MTEPNRPANAGPSERSAQVSARYEAIGALIAAFNTLERHLLSLINALHPGSSPLVQGERAGSLVNAARRLLDQKWGSLPSGKRTPSTTSTLPVDDDYVHALLTRISKLEGRRNDIVHAHWLPAELGSDSVALQGHRVTRSGRFTLDYPTGVEQMVEVTQQIMDAAYDVFVVTWNVGSSLPAMDLRAEDEHVEF